MSGTELGAAPEQLEALSVTFAQGGGQLVSLSTSVSSRLGATSWSGADLDTFAQQWHQTLAPTMARAAQLLSDAAATLRAQAAQQRTASAATETARAGTASPPITAGADPVAPGWGEAWNAMTAAIQIASKAGSLATKTPAMLRFLETSTRAITDYETFLKDIRLADQALAEFRFGKPDGGALRFLIGSRAARVAGKAFLPLTMLSGAADVFTGGGYDGARGWATRGFGLAGAGGAGALLFASSALGPVGLAVAGGAVLAYGAWTLGNLIVDNHQQIVDFAQHAAGWVSDRAVDVAAGAVQAGKALVDGASSAVDGAVSWAKGLFG